MMKKLLVLGMAAMLLCGCGSKETVETEENFVREIEVKPTILKETILEETIIEENIIEETIEKSIEECSDRRLEAAKIIFGEDFDKSESIADLDGVTYNGRFVSWEYINEIAYNLKTNQL